MSKPLVIKLREAKANITESVNAALREGIPCYLLEPIIAELHGQVTRVADNEYEKALKQQAISPTTTEEAGGEKDERAEK